MKKRISLLNNISSRIYNYFPDDRYVVGKELENPNGIIVRSADCKTMEFNNDLLAIARAGVGYNNIPVDRCSQAGICVFNTPGANANAVKELVLGAMIVAYRNIVPAVAWAQSLKGTPDVDKQVEKGKSNFVGPEIRGKKLGVIGLGAIGAMVANDAHSLGMDVYGYDPFMSVEAAWSLKKEIHHANDVESMVSECDIVTIHVPLSDKTRGLINSEVFAKMKKGAVLLNFARGELVDTAALKTALADGTLSKYVTDFPNGEMLELENVICVPHLGASTPESEENCADMAAAQMYDYLQTGNIKNSVNLPACELPPYEGGRITFIHTNTPNMVGQIANMLAEHGVNIAHMNNRSRGELAYTMIDIDQSVSDECYDALKKIDGVIRVRVIKSAY